MPHVTWAGGHSASIALLLLPVAQLPQVDLGVGEVHLWVLLHELRQVRGMWRAREGGASSEGLDRGVALELQAPSAIWRAGAEPPIAWKQAIGSRCMAATRIQTALFSCQQLSTCSMTPTFQLSQLGEARKRPAAHRNNTRTTSHHWPTFTCFMMSALRCSSLVGRPSAFCRWSHIIFSTVARISGSAGRQWVVRNEEDSSCAACWPCHACQHLLVPRPLIYRGNACISGSACTQSDRASKFPPKSGGPACSHARCPS